MADLIGLIVLAVLVAILSLFIPTSEIPGIGWVVIYSVWAVCSLFAWHQKNAPNSSRKWLSLALGSIISAPFFYGVSFLFSRLTFGSSEPELSKTIDIFAALLMAPGATFVAIGGWARMEVKKRLK